MGTQHTQHTHAATPYSHHHTTNININMSAEPSKTNAYSEIAMGTVKENVGWAVGNKQMEAEGLARKEKGNAELEAAKAEQRAIGTKDQAKGNIKEAAGNVLGNEQWQAEGKADQLKGDARKAANQ